MKHRSGHQEASHAGRAHIYGIEPMQLQAEGERFKPYRTVAA